MFDPDIDGTFVLVDVTAVELVPVPNGVIVNPVDGFAGTIDVVAAGDEVMVVDPIPLVEEETVAEESEIPDV